MELSTEEKQEYTKIIDDILASADLNTISEKRIRLRLSETVGKDLTPQKAAIKELILSRFDIFIAASQEQEPEEAEGTDGAKASAEEQSPDEKRAASEVADEDASQKKRRKVDDTDADAALAAKLQAEENLTRRRTRGSGSRKPVTPKKKKTTKSKTSKKVRAEDDSEVEGSDETPKREVNRNTGFHKPYGLSPALSALLDGAETMSRPQTVKKIWEYIRANNLQDQSDRRQINCDDKLRAVFKQDRVTMFSLNKLLVPNLYAIDE